MGEATSELLAGFSSVECYGHIAVQASQNGRKILISAEKSLYHKSQAIYLESKENTKISCVISSVGANEIWVRKTSDSTKMRIYLGQLQRGVFVIRRRSAA